MQEEKMPMQSRKAGRKESRRKEIEKESKSRLIPDQILNR